MQHRHQKDNKNEISFFNDVFHSPANGCVTKSNYKYNTVKHLKMFTERILLLTTKYVSSAPKFLLRNQIAKHMSTLSTTMIWETILHLMSLITNMTNSSRTKPCRQWLLLLKWSPPKFPSIIQKRKMVHLTKVKSLNHRVQIPRNINRDYKERYLNCLN